MQKEQTTTQPQIAPELQRKYNIVKNEYKNIMKAILALEDEKKEHLLFKKPSHRANKKSWTRTAMF